MIRKEKRNFEDLSLPQLHILLKHLSLGSDHLKLLLAPKQLNELYQACRLAEEQQEQIAANRLETLGNMSLTINTIMTSTFGAWMGLSGCIGLGLGSYKVLGVISFIAFFVSGFIGYMSLSTTKNQAYTALDNQCLHQLQLIILRLINQKTLEKIKTTAFYLHTATFLLENEHTTENNSEECHLFKTSAEAYAWYEKLDQILKSRLKQVEHLTPYELYSKQISQMTYTVRKILAKHVKFLEHLASTNQKQQKSTQYLQTLPYLKILTNPSFGIPKYRTFVPSSWISGNVGKLLLGLMPTIWGGFASMFVFVGGIPNITRELGFTSTADFLSQPEARVIEILMALGVTAYFAFSFLYSSRKIWQREKLLEKTEKEIANEETLLLTNTHLLTMLFKIKSHVQKFVSVFNILKKMDGETSNEPVSTGVMQTDECLLEN
jgi:hypothetical protein